MKIDNITGFFICLFLMVLKTIIKFEIKIWKLSIMNVKVPNCKGKKVW